MHDEALHLVANVADERLTNSAYSSQVAAFFASFFCFGLLYERRGFPAAVGAHVAVNVVGQIINEVERRTPLRIDAWLVAVPIYLVFARRWWRRSKVRSEVIPSTDS